MTGIDPTTGEPCSARRADGTSMREECWRSPSRGRALCPPSRCVGADVVRPRVVIAEPEPALCERLAASLRAARLDVVVVDTLAAATERTNARVPDVLLLARELPDGDGLSLCTRLRADPRFGDVALLVLSTRSDEQDRVDALERGADDYVVKPFSERELVARVRLLAAMAVDRRIARGASAGEHLLRWRGLTVDVDARVARIGTRQLHLHASEIRLLEALFAARGQLVSRDALLAVVGADPARARLRRVDVQVWRLRARLEDHGDLIATVHGAGYRLGDE